MLHPKTSIHIATMIALHISKFHLHLHSVAECPWKGSEQSY